MAKSKPSDKAVLKESACLSVWPQKKENKPWSLLYRKQNSKPILVLTEVNLMHLCFSNEPLSLTKHRPAFIYIRLSSAVFWIEDWEVNVVMQAKLIIFMNRLKNCLRFLQLCSLVSWWQSPQYIYYKWIYQFLLFRNYIVFMQIFSFVSPDQVIENYIILHHHSEIVHITKCLSLILNFCILTVIKPFIFTKLSVFQSIKINRFCDLIKWNCRGGLRKPWPLHSLDWKTWQRCLNQRCMAQVTFSKKVNDLGKCTLTEIRVLSS